MLALLNCCTPAAAQPDPLAQHAEVDVQALWLPNAIHHRWVVVCVWCVCVGGPATSELHHHISECSVHTHRMHSAGTTDPAFTAGEACSGGVPCWHCVRRRRVAFSGIMHNLDQR